jgi:hypothetical protein
MRFRVSQVALNSPLRPLGGEVGVRSAPGEVGLLPELRNIVAFSEV